MKDLIKKLAIFLILFTIVAVGTTYGLIRGKINTLLPDNIELNKTEIQESGERISEKVKGIDLYGVYDENDLIINESIEIHNNKEIKIPQIDGLKNIDVQNKINNDIYDRTLELLGRIDNIDSSYYEVTANFANVLSIHIYVYDRTASSGTKYNSLYFNYELIDGNYLKLEDLFVDDADVQTIVREALYVYFSKNNFYEDMTEEWEVDNAVSPDEELLYKTFKNFIGQEEKEFFFSPSEITFVCNGIYISTNMVDIAKDVVIYDKYLTEESLYTRDDIGYENIFTCANTDYDFFESIEYGYLEDNFWFDITVNKSYGESEISGERLEKFRELKDKLYQESLDLVNEYMKKAKDNPDKFYIILTRPDATIHSEGKYDENGKWRYEYSNFANTTVNNLIYEMPIEVFTETYKDKLITAYRSRYLGMNGGVYISSNQENELVTITEDRNSRIYDYVTGTQIEKLTDLFYEDSGYMDVIKEKIATDLFKHYDGYTMDKAEALAENVECTIAVDSILVTIPSLPDYEGIVYFFQFEDEMFKILK